MASSKKFYVTKRSLEQAFMEQQEESGTSRSVRYVLPVHHHRNTSVESGATQEGYGTFFALTTLIKFHHSSELLVQYNTLSINFYITFPFLLKRISYSTTLLFRSGKKLKSLPQTPNNSVAQNNSYVFVSIKYNI